MRLSTSLYLRDVIYGAMDGAVTTFAIVSGVAGAGLSANIVLILGIANVVADGFSMAAGNYLGTKADNERLNGNGTDHGESKSDPRIASVATFVAFLLAGLVPLLPYVAVAVRPDITSPVLTSTILTLMTFFTIGAGKSFFVPVRWWRAGLESLAIGAAAAGLAYGCGEMLSRFA